MKSAINFYLPQNLVHFTSFFHRSLESQIYLSVRYCWGPPLMRHHTIQTTQSAATDLVLLVDKNWKFHWEGV